jgi:chromosome segregation ATPase
MTTGTGMDVEVEIRELKRRVGDLEGAFRVLTGQLRNVHPELQTFRLETDRHFQQFASVLNRLDERLESFLSRARQVELQVWTLRDDVPEMVRVALDSISKEAGTDN